ncbi:hypothetical protein IX51_01135 [uncultured archaeon]|nr:hypothetical protein IX51_01135 [uncultured archaeon]
MILDSLEDRVIKYYSDSKKVLPRYDGHSLTNIPSTVSEMLAPGSGTDSIGKEHFNDVAPGDASKVVLFYIDGISYDFTKTLSSDIGFLGRLVRKGAVSPITAVFPTTTAASCTSLNTGLSPMEHTLLEWELYFHETGALMYTLPFRAVTSKYSRRARKLSPDALFKGETIYSKMKRQGVRSFVLVNRNISKGAYSDRVFEGGTVVPYSYITDCIIQLRNILEHEEGPLYIYVYIESADSVGHTYGPDTEMYRAEVRSISRIIRFELLEKIDPLAAADVSIIMTSDHGQVQIDPARTRYLNRISGLWDSFETHLGDPIPPVGSPRDLFLHVRSDSLEGTKGILEDHLARMAAIMTVDDAIKSGIFGRGIPSDLFHMRAGNLMILPDDGKTIWYRIKGQVPMHLRGLHGGLSRDEMVIPFGIANLSHLI